MALSKFISTVGIKLLTHIGTGIKNFFTYLGTTISKIVKTIATTIQNAFHSIFESIGNSIKNGDASKVGDLLIKVLIGSIVLKIRKFFKDLFGGNKPLVKVDIFENIKKVTGNIKDCYSCRYTSILFSITIWYRKRQTSKCTICNSCFIYWNDFNF